MITYWLYWNGHPIGAVREARGQSDNVIRGIAVSKLRNHPGVNAQPGVSLWEQERRLLGAEVRVHEEAK